MPRITGQKTERSVTFCGSRLCACYLTPLNYTGFTLSPLGCAVVFTKSAHASDTQTGGLLSQVQNTNSQYNLPEIGMNLRYAFNREGVAERFADTSVQKRIQLDLALIGFYDKQLGNDSIEH